MMLGAQERCVIVTNSGRGGKLPSVPDRGSSLSGASYAALQEAGEAADSGACRRSGSPSHAVAHAPAPPPNPCPAPDVALDVHLRHERARSSSLCLQRDTAGRPPAGQRRRRAAPEDAEWLEYGGRWGSTVEAPAQQEWFARAENPVSRSWLQQVPALAQARGRTQQRSWRAAPC